MRQVQLPEDEHQFIALVSEAEAGESLTILRGNRPVAQIIPFPEQPNQDERAAARARLVALMDRGLDMGGVWNGRDELYDRD